MVSRGNFLVFEGCDRSGKTTQCLLAIEALKNKNVKAEYIKFPERSTDIGCIINDYLTGKLKLTDQQIHFLFALNRKELIARMEERLNGGITLVVDRYSFSGIAYSSIKQGMDLTFCCLTEVGLPKPDLVVYLVGSMEVRSRRGGFGAEVYEKIEIQNRVEEAYRKLFKQLEVVDGDGSVEEVHERVMQCLNTNQPSPTTSQPIQYFTMQDFNIGEGVDQMKEFVDETMKKSMLIIKQASSQENEEKELSLNRLTELLTTVKC